jgi:HSP20 family protein
MTSKDWESMMPFGELRREMDRLLDNFVGGIGKGIPFRGHGYPLVNVWESDEHVCVEAEVPGLSMNDIEVQVMGGELTIKGRCPEPQMVDVVYHREERHTGEFSRVIRVPQEVKSDSVDAILKDGLLTIKLPKTDVSRARKVTVRSE